MHKARLKVKEGEKPYENDLEGWVAVKIRKPSVPRQIDLDLFAYRSVISTPHTHTHAHLTRSIRRALLYCFEQLFDLPVTFVGEYVSEQMRKEVDLAHEARNSEKMLAYVMDDVNLKDKVSVPRIVWEYTGASVMTAEYVTPPLLLDSWKRSIGLVADSWCIVPSFVEACKLTDKESLDKMGLSVRTTMDVRHSLLPASRCELSLISRIRRQIATAVFAAMTFKFGFVHADPHPGNILVRKHPNPKFAGQPQIVRLAPPYFLPSSRHLPPSLLHHEEC